MVLLLNAIILLEFSVTPIQGCPRDPDGSTKETKLCGFCPGADLARLSLSLRSEPQRS